MTTQTLKSGVRLTHFPIAGKAAVGVLVLPGGGYGHLAIGHEGNDIAAWLNARGYEAWMLEYRVASQVSENDLPLLNKPMEDTIDAIGTIRAMNRVEKLGVWGFSAGGHLAAHVLTDLSFIEGATPPLDFGILAYPVLDMQGEWVHRGSQKNLLGEIGDPKQTAGWSPFEQVCERTPPVFLFHTANDGPVPVQNSLMMALMLANSKVPFELHVHEDGHHGIGLALDNPALNSWSERLESWLARR